MVLIESAYIHNQSKLTAFKDLNIKKYRFVATLDERTSEVCQAKDGKEFDIDKGEPGESLPPLHPRCRSTIVPVTDGKLPETRAQRRDERGKSVLGDNKDYKIWQKDLNNNSNKSKIKNIKVSSSIIGSGIIPQYVLDDIDSVIDDLEKDYNFEL